MTTSPKTTRYTNIIHKIHKHNTRQSDVLHIKQTSNQKGKKNTKYQGAVFWNSLPTKLIQAETTKNVRINLKNYLSSFY